MMFLYLIACTSAKQTDSAMFEDSPIPFSCPQSQEAIALGTVENENLVEISGIAPSYHNPTRLWAHNDSGDSARIFALQHNGQYEGGVSLGIPALDWEDMTNALAPDGQHYLYIADFGDNSELRVNFQIHKVLEPTDLTATPSFETFTLSYPDGSHNAEAIVARHEEETLYILTKHTERTQVFRINQDDLSIQETNILDFSDLGIEGSPLVTGASLSPDGNTLFIRTYTSILAMDDAVLDGSAPEEICILEAPQEEQGEAIMVPFSQEQYITISEGEQQQIFGMLLE